MPRTENENDIGPSAKTERVAIPISEEEKDIIEIVRSGMLENERAFKAQFSGREDKADKLFDSSNDKFELAGERLRELPLRMQVATTTTLAGIYENLKERVINPRSEETNPEVKASLRYLAGFINALPGGEETLEQMREHHEKQMGRKQERRVLYGQELETEIRSMTAHESIASAFAAGLKGITPPSSREQKKGFEKSKKATKNELKRRQKQYDKGRGRQRQGKGK